MHLPSDLLHPVRITWLIQHADPGWVSSKRAACEGVNNMNESWHGFREKMVSHRRINENLAGGR
jgi:hypothetical protein